MTQKDRGRLRLAKAASDHGQFIAITLPQVGKRADGDFSAINSPLANSRVARNRTDQPIIRPKRKMRRRDFTARESVG